jgi:hypothetical protein
MTERVRDGKVKPPVKPDRAAREAAALRANLLKRKDQARRREAGKDKADSAG